MKIVSSQIVAIVLISSLTHNDAFAPRRPHQRVALTKHSVLRLDSEEETKTKEEEEDESFAPSKIPKTLRISGKGIPKRTDKVQLLDTSTYESSLIESWDPDFFVVGLPYNLDGSNSEFLQRALKFANRLNGRFNIPTFGIDERLSSETAREKYKIESSKNAIRKEIDDVAAQIILETWFSEYNKKTSPDQAR